MDGDVTVFEKNGCAIYHSAAGFYFIRIIQSLEDTIYEDIRTPREYLCTAFEIQSGDESAKKRLLERFQETYGKKYSDMIEHECFNYQCKYILLAKFPTCVVRHLFAKSGGNMRTIISGPTESLKQIPTLVRLGNINKEDERSTSVFVTQYGPNNDFRHLNPHGKRAAAARSSKACQRPPSLDLKERQPLKAVRIILTAQTALASGKPASGRGRGLWSGRPSTTPGRCHCKHFGTGWPKAVPRAT